MRQIRDASNELQHEIKKSGMDIKKDINLSSFVDDTVKEIQQPLDQYVEDIEHAVRYEAPRKSHLNQAQEVNDVQTSTDDLHVDSTGLSSTPSETKE